MKKYSGLITLLSLMLACNFSFAQDKNEDLLKEFITPPNTAKPRVWWHWMNGNISKEGIAKDLLWMNRIGIGGFMNFDAAMATPQIVKKRLTYMTPEWKDAFHFTTQLADSLQLEMAIAGSPGWSQSGGPWVNPKDGMKKLVWSEIRIKGGRKFTGVLPKAPTKTGAFQNIPFSEVLSMGAPTAPPLDYYEDISLMAYKLAEADVNFSDLKPKVTSSGGKFTINQLTDGDLATIVLLPATKNNESAWIQFAFEKPQTFKGITIVGGGDEGPFGLFGDKSETRSLEVSEDGIHFKPISFISAGGMLQQTINFSAATAKYFRITFKNPLPIFSFDMILGSDAAPKPSPGTDIAEIMLHSTTKIDRFEEKAAFAAVKNINVNGTKATSDAIAPENVIDLSDKINADGTLNWTPPAGNWKLIRFGYSLLGITNHPASPEATGLEVDKLDPVAIKTYFENYLDQYKSATGGLMGDKGGLQYIVTDSWEAGAQNWTKNLPAEFAKRRGYSLLPWMPVLTGQIIKSSEASEKFLWDYRKTLGEMLVEYHYDQLTQLLKERGMKRYSESHETGRTLIADGMEVKRRAAVPMGAMWTPGPIGGDGKTYNVDIRESASVAHIYGQNLVAAESFTAIGDAYAYSPERLKPTADMELASGLNRFVIHTSVHQPSDEHAPGLGLGPFGQWFTRHETWAEQATAWTKYLARSSYLLQQGKFVADIIYYYGEDNNITSLFAKKQPNIPMGYNYDFVNADALLNVLAVKDGQIVTPSGMQYKVLALDANSQQMTLKVAQKISELVKAGAIVVGPKPIATPSLMDDKTAFDTLVNELWGAENTVTTIGKGKVYTGESIEKVLKALAVKPDFEYTKTQDDTQLLYVHRKLPEQELYWVNNRNDRAENLEATFRVSGKTVEIWHPETGKTEPASYSFADGRTKVSLHLEPNDAVFIVFKENTTVASHILPAVTETKLTTLEGNWNLSFQKDRGAPSSITVKKLVSWTENSDVGVKYFSGTGTYSKTIDAPKSWFKNSGQLWIDLGEVKNISEVFVNGKSLGIVWKKPFRVDASGILKPGKNTLEIKVTNLWPNRIIGDEQAGAKKITFISMPFYKANASLLPSGLLSSITVLSVK
ncbi:glycoside hydrolase [Flavobacterium franklandianum]|uniref:Glycoside hydrolase n=1 Tax=Flavobacterium franklandianum TaxID=2594430 RepID=A0A553CLH9_9FLAO|nr:glycosyl hydrolase [Flavobacterium franklandianum]TRX21359.1 glycoside hydrolase [Flavobacterium franklandianum]TRX29996.1 glycoside hydrolase [Flavobacterium franklandianum]